jgi:predicted membrane chloride channel (bestrophin family)
MRERLRSIFLILNFKTLVVAVLAVASTYLCQRLNLVADFPLTLIATAVVFPIVFSISGAYKRRENALDEYGSIKAHGRAIYFAARDWLEGSNPETLDKAKFLLGDLLTVCRKLFSEPLDAMQENEKAVYSRFSKLSEFIKNDLRGAGLASGEVSRCNQYLSKMVGAFESIKHIYQYRTPRTLRSFSDVFITVLPPLYGPYFVHISRDYSYGLGYIMPVLFAVILVSLDNIQEHLENPFDQVGEDDVSINAEKFVLGLDS